MCYSSSVAGHNSNAISEDIQRLSKRKEALTREKAMQVSKYYIKFTMKHNLCYIYIY